MESMKGEEIMKSESASKVKAFMSEGAERHQGESLWSALGAEPDAFVFERAAGFALSEARAILAETEGAEYDAQGWPLVTWFGAVHFNQRTLGHGTALSAAQASLASSLSAWLGEGN